MRLGNVARTLILIALFITISFVTSFKCYQCRSDINKGCDKLSSKAYLQECKQPPAPNVTDGNKTESSGGGSESNSTTTPSDTESSKPKPNDTFYCRKISQILYIKSSLTIVVRECAQHYYGESCNKVTNKIFSLNVCDCKIEGCNRSVKSTRYEWSLVITLLIVLNIVVTCFHG